MAAAASPGKLLEMHILSLHPSPGEPGTPEGLGPANPPDDSDAKTGAPLLWPTLTTHWD